MDEENLDGIMRRLRSEIVLLCDERTRVLRMIAEERSRLLMQLRAAESFACDAPTLNAKRVHERVVSESTGAIAALDELKKRVEEE